MIKIILILLLVILCVLISISYKCLMLIVKPGGKSKEQTRKQEIDNGFSDAIEDYENKWHKEAFTLERDNAVLYGEFIENPSRENKVAIIAHGHTANRYNSIKYAKMFYEAGYQIILYDERSFGESTGDYSTLGEKESKDLAALIDMVNEKYHDPKIILHGESMGAATVLLVNRYRKVDRIIADCPFCDSDMLFGEFVVKNLHIPKLFITPILNRLALLLYHYHIKETSPIKAIENCDVPICFIHGTSDNLIGLHHSKAMYDAVRNKDSELHLFEGADHAQSVVKDPERYKQIIRNFISKQTQQH